MLFKNWKWRGCPQSAFQKLVYMLKIVMQEKPLPVSAAKFFEFK